MNSLSSPFAPKAFMLVGSLAAGLAALSTPVCAAQAPEDTRITKLKVFFVRYRSPLALRSAEFLKASDRFGLDWRLLPSLVIVESGGRNIRNNNVFGWGNGDSRFKSISDSIHIVADCLTNRAPYRGKTFDQKMQAYNPRRRDYADFVRMVMRQVDPDGVVAAVPPVSGN